jgi:hypothetical protein
MVGPYQAEFFSIGGLVFESRKRREHLTQEDLRKNKALMETLTKGSSSSLTETSNGEPIRRGSLPAPIKTILSWNDYINCSHPPNLGRQLICKDVSKTFRATVAMVLTHLLFLFDNQTYHSGNIFILTFSSAKIFRYPKRCC